MTTAQELRAQAQRLTELIRARNPGPKDQSYFRSFPIEALMGWILHRGRCVYCGQNLVDASMMVSRLGHVDHLLPKGAYPEVDFQARPVKAGVYLNAVPACHGCNLIKRDWDPNTKGGDPLYSVETGMTVKIQAKLIDRARKHIKEKRDDRTPRFQVEVECWEEVVGPVRP